MRGRAWQLLALLWAATIGFVLSPPRSREKSISVKPGMETYDLVIPSLNLENSVYVTVRRIVRNDGPRDDLLRPVDNDQFETWWLPRRRPMWDLSTSIQLDLWDGKKGFAIKVIVMNGSSVICPSSIKLQVLSNKALPNNSTLTLQFLSRGQLTTRMIKLEAEHACVPQDNEFGHYECGKGDEIRCLKGWTGANCQMPVCDYNGSKSGELCVASDRCTCKPSGKGATLIVKSGSERQSSADNTPRRTFFKYKATLEFDGNFGPEVRAVAYVFDNNQMASDFVKIDGLLACSSPAMAEIEHGGGLQFDKQLVSPGEKVSASLKLLPGKIGNKTFTNTCLLSIIDVSSKQFDTANFRRIDFDAYAGLLTRNQTYGSEDEIQGTEDAYRAAGIELITISPKSKTHKPTYCPFLIEPTYAPLRGHIMGPMGPTGARQSDPVKDGVSRYQEKTQIGIPRIRDFFPEVWLFETAKVTDACLKKSLTVPDTLTTWEANAVCLTTESGLWMSMKKPQLTVRMPFFVEFAPPLMARRGEVLHLPISVFVYPESTTSPTMTNATKATYQSGVDVDGGVGGRRTPRTCYEVEVGVETDSRDWQAVGVAAFTTCICVGDLKQTFYLPLHPLRVGHLNVTAKAVARRGSCVCDDSDNGFGGWGRACEAVAVADAVRRSVRVIAEGVEKSVTLGGIFCTSGESLQEDQEMTITLPDRRIVEGSLRSYVAVSGNVVGQALANLDGLIQLPTGCGEQNLVKVAPSVYALRYLLNRQGNTSGTTDTSRYDRVTRKAATYILHGFNNQLNYRHADNGAFSVFGPHDGSNGSTWLTAYVFEVFSEAEKLPIVSISGQSLDAYATLASAFDFLRSQQRASTDGCFEEASTRFLTWTQNYNEVENRLQLTAHVLAALGSANTALREAKGKEFTHCVQSAIRCFESTTLQLPFTQWPTSLLAKVVYATNAFPHQANTSRRNAMVTELIARSELQSTISGSLRWWPKSASSMMRRSYLTKVLNLETTAYALLALSPTNLSMQDQLATMQWISQQQNEKGGFYSTQDTVVALRALTQNAAAFPSPTRPTPVVIHSLPKSLVDVQVEMSEGNQLVAHTFEIGTHNQSDITNLKVRINSPKPVCVSTHFTAIYNIPKPRRQDDVFDLEIYVNQGGSSATATCTTALTTLCLQPARAQATGMLLVTVQLPSGWTVTMRELENVPLNRGLQKVEFNAQRQEVSAYFNGFTTGGGNAERCFTVPLHQRAFVQNAQPGLVTARDYYNSQKIMQAPLQLDNCQFYWEPTRENITISNFIPFVTTAAIVPPVTGFKPMCPKCDEMEPPDLLDRLNKSLCLHDRYLYVFKTHDSTNRTAIPGLLYSFDYGNRLASWNITINDFKNFECKLDLKKVYGIFGGHIHPGALNVSLTGYEVVIFEDLVKVAPKFKERLKIKMKGLDENEQQLWCATAALEECGYLRVSQEMR
ncbi:Murinoglobulin-2 [Echinococcus granulosus]|uniref:Murinoglobulin-2 n=1 Tax=Echinococcus granulosus TaxID=6210 RepID=W6UPK2_ECHGR|nr:Murinoglobulin-2 [Echinococcus granulosus]EUB63193.1 Murinoglobulin-2 [Echinococcus granulosus]